MAGSPSLTRLLQKLAERLDEDCWMPKRHEMVVIQYDDLALRNERVMLARRR